MPDRTKQVELGGELVVTAAQGCGSQAGEGLQSVQLVHPGRLCGLPHFCSGHAESCLFPKTTVETSGWCHFQNIWEFETCMCFYICRMLLLPERLPFELRVCHSSQVLKSHCQAKIPAFENSMHEIVLPPALLQLLVRVVSSGVGSNTAYFSV